MNQLVWTSNGILFSAKKSYEAMRSHGGTLNGGRQYKKTTYCMTPTIWHSGGENPTMETIRSVVMGGWG